MLRQKILRVGVDAGALSPDINKQFGNYVFSWELIRALSEFDHHNTYTLYLQSKITPHFSNMKQRILKPNLGWLNTKVSFAEICNGNNVFLALNQALPLYTPAKKIAFCHGLSALKFPSFYPDSARRLKHQLEQMLISADKIIVSSLAVKNEIRALYPHYNYQKIVVLPYGIPFYFQEYIPRYNRKRIIMSVTSKHHIKNLKLTLDTFSQFRKEFGSEKYKLVLIGINSANLPTKFRSDQSIIALGHVRHIDLVKYFQEAACLLSTSYYESFNFPVLEAISQKTPVVAISEAIIPELKPHVTIGKANHKHLAQLLSKVSVHPLNIDLGQLQKQFSWANYVNNLITLYE